MRRLLLIRHASTDAVRRAAFGSDEPLDAAGKQAAFALRGALGRVDEAYASPALRARQTALAAGLDAAEEPALAECDFGAWAGRALADVHAEAPEVVASWFADPAAAPHGGESHATLAARVGAWLDEQADRDGRAVAITHGGPIKAAVVHALGAPLEAFWRIDVAPCSVTELHAHDGRWTVSAVNASPLSAAWYPGVPPAVPGGTRLAKAVNASPLSPAWYPGVPPVVPGGTTLAKEGV